MTKELIRFIAGAVCPNCKEMDKIAITPDDQKIYCISCNYKETKPKEVKNLSKKNTPLN